MTNKIVFVFGLPGSGKSYFATRFAERINAKYVNSDRVRKEIFKKREYTPEEKQAVYKAMLDEMQNAIEENKNIVLDATFHKAATRKLFTDQIADPGKIVFIEVQANDKIIKERLKHKREYSEADYSVHKLIADQNEPLEKPHLILQSTNRNIEVMLTEAENHLKENHDSSGIK